MSGDALARGWTAARAPRRRRALIAATAIVVAALAAVALATALSGSSQARNEAVGLPNVSAQNWRDVGGAIDAQSIGHLERSWSLPAAGASSYGSYATTPVIADGVVYVQDLASDVEAIDLSSGRVLWRKSYGDPDEGPNGVAVAEGRVYGATPTMAFALDSRTGRQLWSVTLNRSATAGIDMAPGYHDGIVYVSTVPVTATTQYTGQDVGVLWALDARTGRKLWSFRTIAAGSKGGGASGGGSWYAPAFDSSGSMYVGIGNPAPFPGTASAPWGSSRPGPNLYSDSIVKLDARTGALRWYFQLTPHDLYDWDLQDPPILVRAAGRGLVLAAGKAGIVVALDAETGQPVWERPVGEHDGHDHDGIEAMKHEYSKLRTPATILPGLLGGVIGPMSTNGSELFVPVVNHGARLLSGDEMGESPGSTGELVAVSVRSGAISWRRRLGSPPLGGTTVVNDLVLTTTFQGDLLAFDAASGRAVWGYALPAGSNAGVMAAGDSLVAPAGFAGQGEAPQLVSFRLP
jgi:outer membrane protein assembly factor BamB